MLFRNTHVAHKILRKPYFSGCVVQQAIIDCSDYIKRFTKPRKIKVFRGFLMCAAGRKQEAGHWNSLHCPASCLFGTDGNVPLITALGFSGIVISNCPDSKSGLICFKVKFLMQVLSLIFVLCRNPKFV